MSNIIKFPINKTRPSGDGDKRLKFNIRAVMTPEEFRLWGLPEAERMPPWEWRKIR